MASHLLRSSGDIQVIFIFVLILLVVLGIGALYSKRMVVRRALRKEQKKQIGDFMNGDHGRVTGRVTLAGKTLTAPLSGRPCSYYHVIVQEHRHSGKSSYWKTVINEEVKGDVVIHDGVHYAYVDTSNTKAYLVADAAYSSGTFNDATPELEAFLEKHGLKSTNFFGLNRSMRYREGVLENNETFVVAGQGYWDDPANHQLRLNAQKILVIAPTAEDPVYLSDDPETTQMD